MRIADLHPEELLDRAHRRALTMDEQIMLDEHLTACSACTLDLRIRSDSERIMARTPAQDPMVRRIVAATLAATTFDDGPPVTGWRRVTGFFAAPSASRLKWVVVLLLVSATTGVGAASFWPPARSFVARFLAPSMTELVPPPPARRRPSRPRVAVVEPPPASIAAPDEAPPPAIPAPPRPARRPAVAPPTAVAPPPLLPRPTAVSLFQAVSSARQSGRWLDALAAYRALEERFAGSREEVTARVVMAELALDRDPTLAARFFAAYLVADPQGALSEEARLGRALAFGRLGSRAQERSAWQDLLREHPESIHAPRARARLEALP